MKKAHNKKKPESYTDRSYRKLANMSELVSTTVRIEETDLHILADYDVTTAATDLILQYRLQLENYILKNPAFSASLEPLEVDKLAPPMLRRMMQAGVLAGVGPMAAVAGAVAENVGLALLKNGCREVLVENGGDVFISRTKDCSVAIFAGESPLSYKVGVRLLEKDMPVGICTSSGTVGHSLSFGDADSVTVVATSTIVADAVATRLGNEVGHGGGGKAGMQNALAKASGIEGIRGVVVICGELMGAYGGVELVRVDLGD
jgi:ApbE superfamily uncharacterized protein (UPF0280 family)